MAPYVLNAVMSQATGGGVSYAISLLLDYMPGHEITQSQWHTPIPETLTSVWPISSQ